jgi:hypothetical protein
VVEVVQKKTEVEIVQKKTVKKKVKKNVIVKQKAVIEEVKKKVKKDAIVKQKAVVEVVQNKEVVQLLTNLKIPLIRRCLVTISDNLLNNVTYNYDEVLPNKYPIKLYNSKGEESGIVDYLRESKNDKLECWSDEYKHGSFDVTNESPEDGEILDDRGILDLNQQLVLVYTIKDNSIIENNDYSTIKWIPDFGAFQINNNVEEIY